MPHLLIIFACGALLLRVGVGWYTTGLARSKNAGATALRNVVDLATAALAFWAVGAAILNGDAGLIFDARSRFSGATFMQMVLVIIGTAPVVGAVAERCRFFPMLAAPVLLGGIVIPLCGRWAWSDDAWLRRIGFIDVAGASVLHVAGGMFAAAGAIIAGPRAGKYNRDGSSNLIPGHNVPIVSVGVLIILAAWAPYVLGASMLHELSAATFDRAATNVILAASAGTIVAAVITHLRYRKPDILLAYSGLLGGLVAISAAGGIVSSAAAVAIGAVAGLVVPTATVMLDLNWKIDDPAGAVAVHVVGGAWGTIAAGMFAPALNASDKLKSIGVQALGFVTVALLACAFAAALFVLLRLTIGLRATDDAEFDGLDLAEHDLNAYPDFQQTMIKSYHLRET